MSFYVTTLLIFSFIFLFLIIYLFKNKNSLSINFSFYALAYLVYIIGTLGVLFSKTFEYAMMFQKIKYFGSVFIAPTFIVFLYKLAFGKLKKAYFYLLYLIPIMTLIIMTTNEAHHLFYQTISITTHRGYTLLNYDRGVFHYIHAAYFLSLRFFSLFLLYFLVKSKNKAYIQISIYLIVAFVFGMTLDFLYFFEVFPKGLDITHFVNILQLIIYIVAIFKYKIFKPYDFNDTIVPILSDGVIILDEEYNLLFHNPVALETLPWIKDYAFGKSLITSPIEQYLLDNSKSFIIEHKTDDKTLYYEFKLSISKKNDNFNEKLFTYIFSDATEQVLLKRELERMIKFDGLTNIYNQTSILRKIEEKFLLAKQNNSTFAVLILDIDDFKKVNDIYGHLAGNRVLIKVANEITNYFSCSKCVRGRFGGDEFIMAAHHMEKEIFLEKLNNFSNSITLFNDPSVGDIQIATSIGVGYIDFGTNKSQYTYLDIIDIADKAMYHSKKENVHRPIVKFIE